VTFGSKVDEAGFEGGFNPGDATLVNVGLFLFLGRYFDVQVDKYLAICDGHTQLFWLSRVDQHSLHFVYLRHPGLNTQKQAGFNTLLLRDSCSWSPCQGHTRLANLYLIRR